MKQHFPLRPLDYFLNGNHYTGSAEHLRYTIQSKEDLLEASVWCEDVCLSLAEIKASESFPKTEDGLMKIRSWLSHQYHQLFR